MIKRKPLLTAYLVECLSISYQDGWAKPQQNWHSTHETLEEAQQTVEILKQRGSTIAVAIIEWTAKHPLQHGSNAGRYCAAGQSQRTVYDADRTFVRKGVDVKVVEVFFMGNDWRENPLSGQQFTGNVTLHPRRIPENLKELVQSNTQDLSRIGWVYATWTEKLSLRPDNPLYGNGRSTNHHTWFSSEADFQAFLLKNTHREIQIVKKTVLSYTDDEKDFILNVISQGTYL